MLSISNYSFQPAADQRTCVSLSVSGTVAAILVSLVVLAYLRHLPPITYPIAGGSAVLTLVIGGLIAGVRRKKGDTPEDNDSQILGQSDEIPPSEIESPPTPHIKTVINQATCVAVNRNVGKCHPPSDLWPFVTGEFQFKLMVQGKQLTYTFPVTEFYTDKEQNVWAEVIFENKVRSLKVTQEEGLEYKESGWESEAPIDNLPRADYLNEKIKLSGYLSRHSAWYKLGYLLEKRKEAWYFYTETETIKNGATKTTFKIPQLISIEPKGTTVEFVRDSTQPIIHPDQIALLKNSKTDLHVKLGQQFESPFWMYDTEGKILSINRDGDQVVVEYET